MRTARDGTAGGGGSAEAEGRVARVLRRVREAGKLVAAGLLCFLVLRTFVVEAFRIPTGSMEETLLVGDFLLVNKVAYAAALPGTGLQVPALRTPQVGDVVVFRPPAGADGSAATRYVKRVVGGPGDTVAMRSGALLRNGRRVSEPYARPDRTGLAGPDPRFRWQRAHLVPSADGTAYRPTRRDWGPLVVPPDSFFVLGDNRAASEDSRYWGFVPRDAVTGEPLFVYFSRRPRGPDPPSAGRGIRWRRIFSAVR